MFQGITLVFEALKIVMAKVDTILNGTDSIHALSVCVASIVKNLFRLTVCLLCNTDGRLCGGWVTKQGVPLILVGVGCFLSEEFRDSLSSE